MRKKIGPWYKHQGPIMLSLICCIFTLVLVPDLGMWQAGSDVCSAKDQDVRIAGVIHEKGGRMVVEIVTSGSS